MVYLLNKVENMTLCPNMENISFYDFITFVTDFVEVQFLFKIRFRASWSTEKNITFMTYGPYSWHTLLFFLLLLSHIFAGNSFVKRTTNLIYLQLYDSNRVTSESAALIDKLQGSRVRGPQPFVLGRSRNNYLALQFRSDTSVSRKGFRGTISAGKNENLSFGSLQFLHITTLGENYLFSWIGTLKCNNVLYKFNNKNPIHLLQTLFTFLLRTFPALFNVLHRESQVL